MPVPDRTRRLTAFTAALAILVATPLVVTAGDGFADVPSRNVHHDDITWLQEAVVTLGCNPPDNDEFCPGEPVLRQQMASFIRRLGENRVVHAATAREATRAGRADDAAGMDGRTPGAYRSIAAADLDGSMQFEQAGFDETEGETEVNRLTIAAPQAWILVISGSVYIENPNAPGPALFGLRPAVSGEFVSGAAGNAALNAVEQDGFGLLSYTVGMEVDAGTHTVTQTVSPVDGNGSPLELTFPYNANQLTAEWHPEGSVSIRSNGN